MTIEFQACRKIAIIGSCPKGYPHSRVSPKGLAPYVASRFAYGAGKSTLAKILGKKLNLPVIHLDAYYWQPGWQESSRDRWLAIQQKLVKGDRWIVDGNL